MHSDRGMRIVSKTSKNRVRYHAWLIVRAARCSAGCEIGGTGADHAANRTDPYHHHAAVRQRPDAQPDINVLLNSASGRLASQPVAVTSFTLRKPECSTSLPTRAPRSKLRPPPR